MKFDSAPTLIYTPVSIVERLELEILFPKKQPLEAELGSGDGTFLTRYAALYPERNFIGVERLLGRLRKIERKGLRLGLTNLQLLRIEASYFLEYLLPQKSLTALHIYFPDPWPKRKHRKHRLIDERFTQLARQVLQPDGIVFLRTDDADYFSQMKQVFGVNNSFFKIETPESLSAAVTDFERNFISHGVKTLATAYQLKN